MDNTTGVETIVTTAPVTTEVKSNEQIASTVQAEDLLAVIAEMDAKMAKIETEKENYRKGMLLAKGKTADDSDETIDEKVERLVNEKLLNTEVVKIQSQKDEVIKSALKRNAELELALKNRGQVSTGTSTSVDTTPVAKSTYFSDDQVQALKAKGWDDKKIESLMKNAQKLKGRVL